MTTTATPGLADLREDYATTRQALDAMIRNHDSVEAMPGDVKTEARKLAHKLEDLEIKMAMMRGESDRGLSGFSHPGSKNGAGGGRSLGELITSHAAYKGFDYRAAGVRSGIIDIPLSAVEQKTVLTTTGAPPHAPREDLIIPFAVDSPSVASLFATPVPTDQSQVVYLEETTFTNAAAETAEGATKPESTLVFTERTSPVRKIAVTLRITDEVMKDTAGIAAYLNSRLPLMVRLREDQQLINGDGIAPNLKGILNTAGILTQAKGADPTPDAVYKAATQIRVNSFLEPDGVIMHPLDWQDVRLLRTADGIYIFGDPSKSGLSPLFEMRVVLTTRVPQNTAIVGAFKTAASIRVRESMQVQFSTEDQDNFVTNRITILAEIREALVVYRATGFAQVTGI